jgi:hypothetical protein
MEGEAGSDGGGRPSISNMHAGMDNVGERERMVARKQQYAHVSLSLSVCACKLICQPPTTATICARKLLSNSMRT